MANTGYKSFTLLEKYYKDDGSSAGETKPNVVTDPDYIAPVLDTTSCSPSARYYNAEQTKTVSKNNCSVGEAGTEVTLKAYTNQFVSDISITDANNQAIAWLEENAQVYANNLGTCIPDTTSPTSPYLSASLITSSTLELSWTLSTDNGILLVYDIYQNGVLLGSTSYDKMSYSITGLSKDTTYEFYVKAKDTAGNSSISNTLNITTLTDTLTIAVTKSVIFEKQAATWSECRNASSADLQYTSNNVLGGGLAGSQFYLNRYRGVIDTSSITIKPKSAKIKFKFASNTVGSALTFNLFASNIKIPISQNFQLDDWNDWNSTTFINSVIVPNNSISYNEITLTSAQLDLLISEQTYQFFLISNGDKENLTPATNSRPILSMSSTTGEVYMECKF